MRSWLAWKSLELYLPALTAYGVVSVPELGELSDEELRGRGLNGPAVRRVRVLCGAVVGDCSAAPTLLGAVAASGSGSALQLVLVGHDTH